VSALDAAVEAMRDALHASLCRGVKHRSRWTGECRAHQASRLLTAFAADPARARAVVAFLLTEEELARALHGRLSVERGSINHDKAGLRGEPDAWMRSLARAVLAALRSPDPADA
jgi:hypothetical protein